MSLRSWLAFVGLVGFCLSPLAVGCGSEEAEAPAAETGEEDEVVPADAATLWDQANVCSEVLERHKQIRATDYKDGVVRWNCGDVPGVTEGDLGQEYCEYHAVSGGKVVKTLAEVAPGAPIQCLFTSLYADAFPDADTASIAKFASALKAKENLNLPESATFPIAATQMQVGFNSRGAATALVVDCYNNADPSHPTRTDSGERERTEAEKALVTKHLTEELRQAACWQASIANTAKASALKTACRTARGKLLTESRWKKAEAQGAKVLQPGEAGYDEQRILAACLGAYRSGAVTWRNSDNIICERVTRATNECKCSYSAIPDAFLGFTFGTWNSGSSVPPGCRYAKVDGKDSQNLVICELSSTQRSDLEVEDKYTGNLTAMCQDYFSREIVMSAPIRALQKEGSCQPTAGFCSSYNGQ